MRSQWLLTISLLVPMLACGAVRADTTLVFQQSGAGAARKQPVYISNGRIRFEGGLPHSYVLFDAKTQTVTRVDEQKHRFVRIDEKTLDSIAAAVKSAQAQAMEQMQAQMKNMSPEQQQRVQAMMKSMTPAGGQQAVKPVREVPSSKTLMVNGHKCHVAESYRGDRKLADLCVVSRQSLGMSMSDFATLQAFQKFTQRMARKFPGGSRELELGDPKQDHIPVQVTRYGPDGHIILTKLTSVSHAAIPASQFEVPDGYKQQPVMQSIKRH